MRTWIALTVLVIGIALASAGTYLVFTSIECLPGCYPTDSGFVLGFVFLSTGVGMIGAVIGRTSMDEGSRGGSRSMYRTK